MGTKLGARRCGPRHAQMNAATRPSGAQGVQRLPGARVRTAGRDLRISWRTEHDKQHLCLVPQAAVAGEHQGITTITSSTGLESVRVVGVFTGVSS